MNENFKYRLPHLVQKIHRWVFGFDFFTNSNYNLSKKVRGCIQKFPNWPPGARIANGADLCHKVQLYRYFVIQSSEICRHNTLCCFSTSVYCCKRMFCYRLSPESFGYALVKKPQQSKRNHGHVKGWRPTTTLHGVRTQKTSTFLVFWVAIP
jgi:hypothetical protein